MLQWTAIVKERANEMDKMTRRSLLDILARGGLACGGCCALSRFALLDALAADADHTDPQLYKVAAAVAKVTDGDETSYYATFAKAWTAANADLLRQRKVRRCNFSGPPKNWAKEFWPLFRTTISTL